jgi:hypothetical protein
MSSSTPSAPPELADGKYLYSPASGRIEVQWIQGIGSENAAAPQARLMATVINGILSANSLGPGPDGRRFSSSRRAARHPLAHLRRRRVPLHRHHPRHLLRRRRALLVDRALKKAGQETGESEISPGALYASGLIAAGGIVGLIGVAIKAYESLTGNHVPIQFPEIPYLHSDGTAVVMFAALAFSLYYFARKPMKS